LISLGTYVNSQALRHAFWAMLAGVLLSVAPSPVIAASDADFAKSELTRIVRGKISGRQAQTFSMIERYQRNKAQQNQLKRSQVLMPVTEDSLDESAEQDVLGQSDETPGTVYSFTAEECSQFLDALIHQKPEEGRVKLAQEQLIQLGYYDYKVDGILGTKTQQGLLSYCRNASFALSEDLLTLLAHHTVLSNANSAWASILSSPDFRRWKQNQRDFDQIDATMFHGSPKSVIALLDRYKNRQLAGPPLSLPTAFISYVLAKDDIAALKTPGSLSKVLASVTGKTFASPADFDAALEIAFKSVKNPERYLGVLHRHAAEELGLALTDESFKRLKVKGFSPKLLPVLEPMKGLAYPRTQLSAEVNEALGPVIDGLSAVKPDEIAKAAISSGSGWKFSPESTKKLADQIGGNEVAIGLLVERLHKLGDVEYASQKSITVAMRNVLSQLREDVSRSITLAVAEAEEMQTVELTEEAVAKAMAELSELAVPELYIDLIENLLDVEYPTSQLFWQALKARVSMVGPNHILKRPIFQILESLKAVSINEALLKRLREEKIPRSVVAQLGTLSGQEFDSTISLQEAIEEMFLALSQGFETYRPMILAQGKKSHPIDVDKAPLWTGGDCNCVNTKLSGTVYGFYPRWHAGEVKTIDFSLMNRIGYMGLTFDDEGELPNAVYWEGLDQKFIRTAQSYGTKLDLVISRNIWHSWNRQSAADKAMAFDKLGDNIARLIAIPLDDALSRALPYLTFGLSRTPAMADGVTLFMDGYPKDPDSVALFSSFLHGLSDRLAAQKRPLNLNLMFHSSDLQSGIYHLRHLAEIKSSLESEWVNVRFIVLLQEPSTLDKKILRQTIEDNLPSVSRMKVLRSVIMVTTYDGLNEAQLNADVIFAENNFGGIGFWPLSYATGEQALPAAIPKAIKKWFLTAQVSGGLQGADVCRYVCPNRWGFRLAWGGILILGVCLLLLYATQCEVRQFMERHFVYLILGIAVPLFLISMALMSCDPAWAEISNGNDPLAILVIGIIVYSLWRHWDGRRNAELP
jgi:hypothetical protein